MQAVSLLTVGFLASASLPYLLNGLLLTGLQFCHTIKSTIDGPIVGLGYGIYRGYLNATSKLNVFNVYGVVLCHAQFAPGPLTTSAPYKQLTNPSNLMEHTDVAQETRASTKCWIWTCTTGGIPVAVLFGAADTYFEFHAVPCPTSNNRGRVGFRRR